MMVRSSTAQPVLKLIAGSLCGLLFVAFCGCKLGSLPKPSFPKFASGKGPFARLAGKKDDTLAPPSRHFDSSKPANSFDDDTQIAIKEPNIQDVAALNTRPPSMEREPTRPANPEMPRLAYNGQGEKIQGDSKSPNDSTKPAGGGFGFPANADSIAKSLNQQNGQPIRTPYEVSPTTTAANDRLKDAASQFSKDLDRISADSKNQIQGSVNNGAERLASAGNDVSKSLGSMAGNANTTANQAIDSARNSMGQFTMPTMNSPQVANNNANSAASGPESSEPARAPFSFPKNNFNAADSSVTLNNNKSQFAMTPGAGNPTGQSENRATINASAPLTPASSENAFPSTGFGEFSVPKSAGSSGGFSMPAATPAGNASTGSQTVNNQWVTSVVPKQPASTPPPASGPATQASGASGLPSSLMQRAGTFAPGSTRVAAESPNSPWR